jgi:hypothetical protein
LDIPLLIGSELAAIAWEISLQENDISRDQWPPFAVHIIYQGAVSLIKRKRAAGIVAVQLCLQPFKSALKISQQRWLSAGKQSFILPLYSGVLAVHCFESALGFELTFTDIFQLSISRIWRFMRWNYYEACCT